MSGSTILAGNNTVASGGPGNDTIWGDTISTDPNVAFGKSDSLVGNGGDDLIYGQGGNDTLVGNDGLDTLYGGDGNDYLHGGDGADVLSGGNNDDTLAGGPGADILNGGTDNDIADYSSSTAAVSVNLQTGQASGGDAEGDQFNGVDGIIGSAFNDSLVGFDDEALTGDDTYFNIIHGGDGDDFIDGRGGGDSLYGDTGNDTIVGGSGNDSIDGGDGDDSITGDEGDDIIAGGAGRDTIRGGTGNDSVDAGDGDDLVIWRAGDGNDTLRGGAGTDTLELAGWTGPTNVSTDVITNGTYGSWTVSGSAANRIFSDGTATITASSFEGIVCFAAGTRIATARGEVAVEKLRVGDLVVAGGGAGTLQPVIWLGHARTDVRRHPNPAQVAPILVTAGALGRGVPFRDLRVSPDHALFLDGHLVPAKLLVNGATIIQELWCPVVDYWHVELPAHGLLVSEGALTESYLDDGNRDQFANGSIARLFPDFEARRGNGLYDRNACYPVLRSGPRLEAIRERLAAGSTRAAKPPKTQRRA